MLDQNDSIMALSKESPIVPNDGISPDERILLVNAHEVNCTQWSAWTIPPTAGCRFLIAISSALTTRAESLRVVDRPANDLPRGRDL